MAKDPAILWYWNDWIGGTMTMTRQAKGAYMDLLSAQFNSGHLTETQIRTLLGQDQGLWVTVLREKFFVDGDGRYYNERLDNEISRRKAFSLKQSENGKRGGRPKGLENPTLKPDESLLETVNEIELRDRGLGKGWNTMPGPDRVDLPMTDVQAGAIVELFGISKQQRVSAIQVRKLWNIFKIQQFTGKNFYKDGSEPYSHFLNWCKRMEVKDIPTEQANGNGLTSREKQDMDLLKSINERR